jgi:type III pantothenate kinase
MRPTLVADIGNSRIKWGRCNGSAVVETASLPPNDPPAWEQQLERWQCSAPQSWAIADVIPARCDHFSRWAKARGHHILLLEFRRHLPLPVEVPHPENVGMDRLLNAVAAKGRSVPAVIVDAGSAVTVDWVDKEGAFRGGAIFPGIRMMALALKEHTALLPRVEISSPPPPMPADSTTSAIHAGIFAAVSGGIRDLTVQLVRSSPGSCTCFLTGGDAPLLQPVLGGILWPEMTLEGIRIAAESLP